MATLATATDHALRYDAHFTELNQAGFVARIPNGSATTTCSCGLTTGPDPVPATDALRVYEEHKQIVQRAA